MGGIGVAWCKDCTRGNSKLADLIRVMQDDQGHGKVFAVSHKHTNILWTKEVVAVVVMHACCGLEGEMSLLVIAHTPRLEQDATSL
eukprot:1136405-Pelagomonas_calceolata.AAC.3